MVDQWSPNGNLEFQKGSSLQGIGTLCTACRSIAVVQYRLSVPPIESAPVRGSIIAVEGTIPMWDSGDLILQLHDGHVLPIRVRRGSRPGGRLYHVTERTSRTRGNA